MNIKTNLLLACFFLTFNASAASTDPISENLEDLTRHEIILTPERFIAWSHSDKASGISFDLGLNMNNGAELTAFFWEQLTLRAPQIKGLYFHEHFFSRADRSRQLINLEPLKTINFPQLTEFSINGLNPGREFIHSFQEQSFCKNLKILHICECVPMTETIDNLDVIGPEQIAHIINIPSLQDLDVLEMDHLSKPWGLRLLASSPYIRPSKLYVDACNLSIEDATILGHSEIFQNVQSLKITQISNVALRELLSSAYLTKLEILDLDLLNTSYHGSYGTRDPETILRIKDLSKSVMTVLSQSPQISNLTHFTFSGDFSEEVGEILGSSEYFANNIRYLSLDSQISFMGLEEFLRSSKVKSIKTITLAGDSKTPIVLDALNIIGITSNLTSLESLGITMVPVETIKSLFSLPYFTRLKMLEIGDELNPEEADILLANAHLFLFIEKLYTRSKCRVENEHGIVIGFTDSLKDRRAALSARFQLIDFETLFQYL